MQAGTANPQRTALVADDHPLIRESLERLLREELGLDVLDGAADSDSAITRVANDAPDLLVLDLRLPGMGGLKVLETLQDTPSRPGIVICSGIHSGAEFAQVDRLGAEAIVSKEDSRQVIAEAASAALARRRFRSETVRALLAPLEDVPFDGDNPLTPREREIAALIADGLIDGQIAGMLAIAPKTVKKHRENIRTKLGAHNGVEIARAAARMGLLRE